MNDKYSAYNASMKDAYHSLSNSKAYAFSSKFYDTSSIESVIKKRNSDDSITSPSSSLSHSNQQVFNVETEAKSIIDILKSDDFIPGEISKTELYLENLYAKNANLFRDSFQKAWLELYSGKENHISNFICISSSLDYDMLEDRADTLVIAGYAHTNPVVNEAVIRAIEMWGQVHHIGYLENMRPTEIDWLDNYKDEVIRDLKSSL
ncbi:hypothetical protein [Vibrio sp. OPT10]|uniref:hypothetical protein n=1 Tax=Vibrio sp. OPT10 TaxID=2778640 RepID=UPI0018824461|nr:hypothetical protein [Vibrio sp. OPT10]MBE8607925.1 hypothetical protein [Vibrio sp. OPT10]